jgi:hypothetical protein
MVGVESDRCTWSHSVTHTTHTHTHTHHIHTHTHHTHTLARTPHTHHTHTRTHTTHTHKPHTPHTHTHSHIPIHTHTHTCTHPHTPHTHTYTHQNTHTHTHTHTLLLVGFLWTRDRPDAQTSAWQLTTLTTDICMLLAGFQPAVVASERPQTRYALDRAATGIGRNIPDAQNSVRLTVSNCKRVILWAECFTVWNEDGFSVLWSSGSLHHAVL